MSLPVLAVGTVAKAVVESCLEAIKVRPHNVDALVRHQSSEMLSHTLEQDASFAVMNAIALFQQHRRSLRCKSVDTPLESLPARKGKVVRIACVLHARRSGESAQAAIEAMGADIGESRRGGRALRQVRTRIQASRFSELDGTDFWPEFAPDFTGWGIRTNASQQIGHRLWIARRAKKGLNSGARQGRKEIL